MSTKLGLFILLGLGIALVVAGHLHADMLEHRRILMNRGEWWRPITGSFTHANTNHLIHNLSTITVLLVLFGLFARKKFAAIVITHIIMYAIFCGLLAVDTELSYYRGLSGPAHGMWLILGVAVWANTVDNNQDIRRFGAVIALLVVIKVAIEQYTCMPIAALWEAAPQYPVMTASHLYGLCSASLATALTWRWLNNKHHD